MTALRRGAPQDIPAIDAIIRGNWAGQRLLPEVAAAQMSAADASIWVAEQGGQVAGFVSGFRTSGADGTQRWELDLIAAAPESQRQGIGQLLIQASGEDAAALGATHSRALIRTDNAASQRAFARASYSTNGLTLELLLWPPGSPGAGSAAIPPGVLLLPVDTLTYRGLWIEGLDPGHLAPGEQRVVIGAARTLAALQGRASAGALIPQATAHRLPADLQAAAAPQGVYQWWVRDV